MPNLSDLYKRYVPTNARLFGESLLGNTAPITEKDFSSEELQAMLDLILKKSTQDTERETQLRSTVRSPESYAAFPNIKGGKDVSYDDYLKEKNSKLGTYDKTRGKTSVQYNDYPDTAMPDTKGWMDSVKSSYTNPTYGVATSLGQFNAQDQDNHYQVQDQYNWNPSGPASLSDLFEVLKRPEAIGNALMRLGPQVSRPVNINIPKR
jgi:hypothetical protein